MEVPSDLTSRLLAELGDLLPHPQGTATERVARRRWEDAIRQGVSLVGALSEPHPDSELKSVVVEEVTRLHLWARLVDDAVDEALSVHRRAVLRAQPLFWRAVSRLASLAPERMLSAEALIRDCIHAVEEDDRTPTVLTWGTKNGHLLIAPLVLAPERAAFEFERPLLTEALLLLQAPDELEQGAAEFPAVRRELEDRLVAAESTLEQLGRAGYLTLAHSAAAALVRVEYSLR